MKDRMIIFAIVTTIIGFMVAIQFKTTKEPVIRDTRDILQLQQDLRIEKERQQELNQEIEKTVFITKSATGKRKLRRCNDRCIKWLKGTSRVDPS
ncbi:hypothetical protein [Anaerobacillus sp. CMMVII]|uniref:hypothetical protein n=1 Tax=Anaerobacillus sp. CMMVII TaxID=2755588 RepID=UPI0021B84BDA|nr:hypothetical protein [Anaerobacillus sp. CMMVII]